MKKYPYLPITLAYVVVWTLTFSLLERNVFLLMGLMVAVAYGAGQIYELYFRDHMTMSADSTAFPAAGVMAVIATVVLVKLGMLPPGGRTYLAVVIRFFMAFAAGHTVVVGCGLILGWLWERLRPTKSE